MIPLLIVSRTIASECTVARTGAELAVALEAAEAAWGIDESAFSAAVASADAVLPCVDGPVAPAVAARYHRVRALTAFVAHDSTNTQRAFAAAHAIEPAWRIPEAMAPAQNPLHAEFEAAILREGASETAPAPAGGARLYFDGTETRRRPAAWPTVFQMRERDGRVHGTAWVPPGEPLPAYRAGGEGWRLPLLLGSAVAAGGAGALYVLAVSADASYRASGSLAEADAARARVNGLAGGAVGVGACALATGGGAFLFARW